MFLGQRKTGRVKTTELSDRNRVLSSMTAPFLFPAKPQILKKSAVFLCPKAERRRRPMYFTSGSDRAFEQLMQAEPGFRPLTTAARRSRRRTAAPAVLPPALEISICVYAECPYQPGKLTALDAVKFRVKGVDDEMAVFRVEKNRGYTVMSNHHLRNKDLSLKAKGLLSQMLSLPEDWDYTLKGLSLINRGADRRDPGRDVGSWNRPGIIVRSRERDSQGRMRGADYMIYEQPQPVPDSPTLENPMLDNPTQEKPTLGKPTQLNKDISK